MRFNRSGAVALATATLSGAMLFTASAASAAPSTPATATHTLASAATPSGVGGLCEGLVRPIPFVGPFLAPAIC